MLTLTGPFVAEPAKAWLLHRRGLDGPGAARRGRRRVPDLRPRRRLDGGGGLSVLLLRGALPHALRVPAEGMLVAVAILTLGCVIAAVTGQGLIVPAVRGPRPAGRASATKPPRAWRAWTRPSGCWSPCSTTTRAGSPRSWPPSSPPMDCSWWKSCSCSARLGSGPDSGTAFVLEGAVKCIGALFFFVPGQLGVSEGIYALLLPLVGLPAAAGVTIILLRRARALAVGAAGFLFFARPAGIESIDRRPPCFRTRASGFQRFRLDPAPPAPRFPIPDIRRDPDTRSPDPRSPIPDPRSP